MYLVSLRGGGTGAEGSFLQKDRRSDGREEIWRRTQEHREHGRARRGTEIGVALP